MKTVLLIIAFSLIIHSAKAQQFWDGGAGTNLWGDALNWHNNQIPQSGDSVVLDNTFLQESYEVVFPDADYSLQLTALRIYASDTDSIVFVIPNSNTASAALLLSGSGDALCLQSGAILKNASGAGSGTPLAVGSSSFFRIENGARYIHQTERGHTTGLVSRLSTAKGTEKGIFEFDVPGTAAYTVSISNRTYGALHFTSRSAGTTRTYTGAGINPLRVRSDLRISEKAIFSYGSNVNNIQVLGDCYVEENAQFNLSNGINSSTLQLHGNLYMLGRMFQSGALATATIEFNGNSDQVVAGKGTWERNVQVVLNNPNVLNIEDTVWLPANLYFNAGKIKVNENAMLGIRESFQIFRSNTTAFIEGTLARIGESIIEFPVGHGELYAPLRLSAGNSADSFYVSYHRNNPQYISGNIQVQDPLHHLSFVEYWKLQSNSMAGPRLISLWAGEASFVGDPSQMVVAQYDSPEWSSLGLYHFEPHENSSLWATGFLHSEKAADKYHFVTLASIASTEINPLPVQLLFFKATLLAAGKVNLQWKLAEYPTHKIPFTIYRKDKNEKLKEIIIEEQNWSENSFSIMDSLPETGNYYYWISWEEDEETRFSKVEQVRWYQHEQPIVYPNPSSGNLFIKWNAQGKPFQIVIKDLTGRLYHKERILVANVSGEYKVITEHLPAGLYIVQLISENIQHAVKWIKL